MQPDVYGLRTEAPGPCSQVAVFSILWEKSPLLTQPEASILVEDRRATHLVQQLPRLLPCLPCISGVSHSRIWRQSQQAASAWNINRLVAGDSVHVTCGS
jgi:hypothetical protein